MKFACVFGKRKKKNRIVGQNLNFIKRAELVFKIIWKVVSPSYLGRQRGSMSRSLKSMNQFAGVIRRAVIIGNGVAGAENQCIGLIRALGLSGQHSITRVIRPTGGINKHLHWLPISIHTRMDNILNITSTNSSPQIVSAGLSDASVADAKQIAAVARETFEKDGPLLVVASGRDTIPVSSSIKHRASDNVFVVQIQHPRTKLDRFDMVITPRHDYYPLTPQAQKQIPWFLRSWITPREPPDQNVVLTVGALHKADPITLQNVASAWHNELAPLRKPLLVVNIGGPTRHCRYGVDLAKEMTTSLQSVLLSCGSVRISFSRRTPLEVRSIIARELGNNPMVYIWDGKDPNPHLGHLAWADAFLVTADSVSMLSEACSTGKPVYVIGAERCTWKFADFHKTLLERGAVRPFTNNQNISDKWVYPPLNDTAEAASKVIEALAKRGWKLQRLQ